MPDTTTHYVNAPTRYVHSRKVCRAFFPTRIRPLLVGVLVLLSSLALPSSAIADTQILIRAAGDEGTELFNLLVDGNTVGTYSVGTFFSDIAFSASGDFTASDIRIEFFNDVYDPANGIDANLVIDYIEVNGTRYETEDTSVFSTGTWVEPEGIQPGFGRGESLHSNGYFQFASAGSKITFRVSGDEGTEQFRLILDGVAVGTYGVTTEFQDYTYEHDEVIRPDQVRISFFNDVYDPDNGIDANLNVAFVQVDDDVVQTQSATVFSTGTWVDPGIVPGFGRGETLHSNGYFQFGTSPVESGIFRLEGSVFRVSESMPLAEIRILRTGASESFATIDFQTLSGTATDGEDFFAQFGSLPFEIGDSEKTIFIPIVDDNAPESEESFSFAIDNPTGAGLLAPRTATVTIDDNDDLSPFPNYGDFSDLSELTLNGSATVVENELQLTAEDSFEVGSTFFNNPLLLTSDTSFQTVFSFEIGGGTGRSEGLAFVVQADSDRAFAVGEGGSGLGFVGIEPSLAVRFDTSQSSGEASNNFVAVSVGGVIETSVVENLAVDLNGGGRLQAFIDYNGETDLLAVYLGDGTEKPLFPALITSVDLSSEVGREAFVGFTASTGNQGNAHTILDWTYDDTIPPNPNTPPATPTVEIIRSGLANPTSIDFSPDGRNMYIAEQRGLIYVVRDGIDAGQAHEMLAIVNGTRDRGLLDIAIHPQLSQFPFIYTLYTYDPPQVYQNATHNLAGPDKNGNRAARLSRWTLTAASDFTRVDPDSEVVILGSNSTWNNFNAFANSTSDFDEPPAGILSSGVSVRDFVATDSESHTIGSVEFASDGALIVSIGDGTSYNRVDPRTTRVQDIDNLSGKILRIDALDGGGLVDNPFYNNDRLANRSKVYQYGVRNPFRITIDPITDNIYVGDVGWTAWEEINVGPAGANFGWPFYEGGDQGNLRTNGYRNLPEAIAFYGSGDDATAPATALSHPRDGINAIVLGAVYRGSTYPVEYQGDLFFNDLGQGIVRHADVDADGQILDIKTFTTGARYVVQIVQGPDGNLYFVDLDDGRVGRWVF